MNLEEFVGRTVTNPLMAGIMGALVGLRFAPGAAWWERIGNVFAGALCAGYLSPAVAYFMGLASMELRAALAFMLGMFGMSLAAALVQAIRETQWAALITRRLGGKGAEEK